MGIKQLSDGGALLARLVLFDVDMTLLWTRGAGTRAIGKALESMAGKADGFRNVEFAGRTDLLISRDGLVRSGLEPSSENMTLIRSNYLRFLALELSSHSCEASSLPGVPELLEDLREEPSCSFGLLTGNWREGAWLKLSRCDLDGYFSFGSFAEDGNERIELVPPVLEKAAFMTGVEFEPDCIWIVGDTPHDIMCASHYGYRSVGVATGPYSKEALEASGATAVFDDLSDTDAFIRLISTRGSPS